MLVTALAQLRLAIALLMGRPVPGWALSALVAAAVATQREFGTLGTSAAEAVTGPALDADTQREVQLRRFRSQARRAAAAPYYGRLFQTHGLNPGTLTWEEIAGLPLTPKAALRDDPDAFLHPRAQPVLRATTHGTTGEPTRIAFSAAELRLMAGFAALGWLLQGHLGPEDVVQINTASGALLGNWNLTSGAAQIGALVQPAGLVAPERSLALLSRPVALPGKKPRVSLLSTYPSYLGALVESGLALGYRPSDFGLERIFVGGEIVTAGLKTRARALFGEVAYSEGWAMSETFPFCAQRCEQGHLHAEPSHGLLEVLDPNTAATAAPGTIGVLVATPFAPFRETTPLLRYDTGDLVRTLSDAPPCTLRQQPATSDLLGKRSLSLQQSDGKWITPRQVLEALEALEEVPLPARCGFWAVPYGVRVEVVVRTIDATTERAITVALKGQGVPLRQLRLVTDRSQLHHPLPLRGDLRELQFALHVENDVARLPVSRAVDLVTAGVELRR
jgi:phenylacetate-coenzyme A ligase PaaK-like adenylate-forming protein